jgi:hypothetical protein
MVRRCASTAARASPPKARQISNANSGVELLLEPLLPVLVGGGVIVVAVCPALVWNGVGEAVGAVVGGLVGGVVGGAVGVADGAGVGLRVGLSVGGAVGGSVGGGGQETMENIPEAFATGTPFGITPMYHW